MQLIVLQSGELCDGNALVQSIEFYKHKVYTCICEKYGDVDLYFVILYILSA